RLDSDADAVHLATIHSSKGLQYPVVMLPFVADRNRRSEPGVLHFHGEDRSRLLDIGITSDPGRRDRVRRHLAEEDGESLRRLYVAMTRAQSQVVTWWFPSDRNTPCSPLHRMLLGRRGDQAEVPVSHPVPGEQAVEEQLLEWERRGGLRLEHVAAPHPVPREPGAPPARLTARRFTREVDDAWRRTSYTALTRPMEEAPTAVGDQLVGSEPEVTARED